MTSHEESVRQLIDHVRSGDEKASRDFWDRYFPQLVAVTRQRMSGKGVRVDDAEDVALSVLESFYQAVEQGRFQQLLDENSLWKLLSAMAYRKIVDRIRWQNADKRRPEVGESAAGLQFREGVGQTGQLDRFASDETPPEFAVEFEESVGQLLNMLNPLERKVARLRLEGFSNEEIAQRIERHTKSVERLLRAIRMKWEPRLRS